MECSHCHKDTFPIKSYGMRKQIFCEHCHGCLCGIGDVPKCEMKSNRYGTVHKYSIDNCPLPEAWFSNGGRCGTSDKCSNCVDNSDIIRTKGFKNKNALRNHHSEAL